ncbi:MAG: hypothetical protein OEM94_04550 [Acidimicrobiia bacterium]|nr:hypothetical protein [Acidimicrobiia bacterium]
MSTKKDLSDTAEDQAEQRQASKARMRAASDAKVADQTSRAERAAEPERAVKTAQSEKMVRPAGVAATPHLLSAEQGDPRQWLITQLRATLEEGKGEVAGIRRRLQITYWSMIVLTVGLFVFGIALIGFPALAYYRDSIEQVTFAALGGAGGLVIALLLYFRPLERLPTMLADATYVSLIKDSFQYQVTLRLLALDLDDSKTVSEAASHVGEAAQASMDLVYTQLQARRAAGG